MKLYCLSYTDEQSSHKDSVADLNLGAKHGMLGCNDIKFRSMEKGDLVLITASPHKLDRLFLLAEIQEKLDRCTLWEEHGGKIWDYNYTYKTIIGITPLTPGLKQISAEICRRHGLNPNSLFNMRFCSNKFIPVVRELIVDMEK